MTDKTDSPKKDSAKKDAKGEESYKVLARKYRPSHFDELIGQDALVRTLKNAIESGRIHHAYMLHGVRGVGKTTTARIIARALNYTGADGNAGPTTGPTDDCEACESIANDRHPDVMEMDAASRTGVDDIREILDGVRYAPVSARYKVYIIDEVHMLSKQAFNALLKTLEEPPPQVIFIFATTEIRKVPVTVLSRCQRFDLKRVDVQTLQGYYKTLTEKEGVSIDDGALALIAQAADGSVRDGLSLLDQAIAQFGTVDTKEAVSLDQVQDMLGLADRSLMISLFEAALTGKIDGALETLGSLFKNGADPAMVLQDLIDLSHTLTRFHLASDVSNDSSQALTLGPDLAKKAQELAKSLSMSSLGRAWDILLQGFKDMQLAPNPEKSVEMTIIRLSYAANLPDPAKLLRDLEKNGPSHDNQAQTSAGASDGGTMAQTGNGQASSAQTSSAPQNSAPQSAPQSAQASASVSAPAHANNGGANAVARRVEPQTEHQAEPQAETAFVKDLETLEDVVEAIEAIGQIRLATDIRQYVRLVSLKKNRIECNLAEGTPKTFANEMQKALLEATGERWFISISSAPGQAPLIEKERAAHAAYMEEVRNHPLVKQVLEAFPGAQVESVSPLKKNEEIN